MRGASGFRSGGTRGGQAEFKWEDVKADKYRECYLGHSVNASVGRWQQHKDLQWYSRSHPGARASAAAEIAREQRTARERDEDLLNQQLGIAPKRRKEPAAGGGGAESGASLDAAEMKELLARGVTERDARAAERIGGIGTGEAKRHEHVERKTLAQQYQDELDKMASASASASARGVAGECLGSEYVIAGSSPTGSAETERRSDRKARKEAKKARKKERKKRKKAKKERKKRKKEAKAARKRSKTSATDGCDDGNAREMQSSAVAASQLQQGANNAAASAVQHRRTTRWDVESKETTGSKRKSRSRSRSRSHSRSRSRSPSPSRSRTRGHEHKRSRLDSFQSSSSDSSTDSDSASSG